MSALSEHDADRVIRLFQSETQSFEEETEPARARHTIRLLALMISVLVVVAVFFPIDRVVTSSFGQLVTTESSIVIEPLDVSIIRSIDVTEGQRVRKGQLLTTLDQTFTSADVNALVLQISSLDAQIERCRAELAGEVPVFASGAPGSTPYVSLQSAYYVHRKAAYDSQIVSYAAQIDQQKATLIRLGKDLALYRQRGELANDTEMLHEKLVSEHLDSALALYAAGDQHVEMQRLLQFDQNSLVETEQQIRSIVASRDSFIHNWRAQVDQELVGARNQRDSAAQQLDKANRHQDLVALHAPEDAIVLRLARLSVGAVLQPGQSVMELALLRSPIEAEIYLSPRDVGFVRAGDHTTIKLDPYNFVEHGWVEGTVRWISEGTFVTPDGGTAGTANAGSTSAMDQSSDIGATSTAQANQPFYKARISVDRLALHNVPAGTRLLPGTTLEADIHVGTRSLFWYMMRGIIRGVDEAMREP